MSLWTLRPEPNVLRSGRGGGGSVEGIGSFHVHPGHSFDGLLIEEGGSDTILALCGCGRVLCRAGAVFSACPECTGTGVSRVAPCPRCGGRGEVVDHAALEWRPVDDDWKGATRW